MDNFNMPYLLTYCKRILKIIINTPSFTIPIRCIRDIIKVDIDAIQVVCINPV